MAKKDFSSVGAIIKNAHNDSKSGNIKEIEIDLIKENENNFFNMNRDPEYLALLESIKVNGLLHPIAVFLDGDTYTVISGHRRLAASKEAGKKTISSAIINFENEEDSRLAMIDANLTSRTLTPFEISNSIKVIEEILEKNTSIQLGKRRDYIGSLLGLSGSQVQRYKSIENLTDKFKELIKENKIGMSVGEIFATLTEDKQELAYEKVMEVLEEKAVTRDDAKLIKKELLKSRVSANKYKNIKVNPNTFNAVKKYCSSNKLNMSEIIEDALAQYLNGKKG